MKKELIEQRKTLVAEFHLKGFSTREISKSLAEISFINPDTDEPFSHETIAEDIRDLKTVWAKHNIDDLPALRAAHVAELQLVKKYAWLNNDMKTLLNALSQEAKVQGLDAPIKVENKHLITADVKHSVLEKLNALKSPNIS